mmetsp:Transcript_4592/g.7143  ORF Transcript_4592/g.7143 Transcript_4592/m.7143 type:complete len:81 (-) Transcript_4592:23-265(-)
MWLICNSKKIADTIAVAKIFKIEMFKHRRLTYCHRHHRLVLGLAFVGYETRFGSTLQLFPYRANNCANNRLDRCDDHRVL